MNHTYAVRNGLILRCTSSTGTYSDGETIYETTEYLCNHESGCAAWKLVDGKHVPMTEQEMAAMQEYKSWWNTKIEAQLEKLDIKRIRPSAEINSDDTSSQDKTAAKAALKTLNAQAAALRAQLLK